MELTHKIYYKKQDFFPGDSWLYIKLYGSMSNLDCLIATSIFDITKILLNKKLISRWFFIRYNDPDFHLRLRFEVININQLGEIIIFINKKLQSAIKSKTVYKITIDTYNREVERYGGFKMTNLSESVFYYDSQLIVRILQHLSAENKLKDRWKFGFVLLDRYLDAFQFTLNKKLEFIKEHNNRYLKEFGYKNSNQQLSRKYRLLRRTICDLIEDSEKYINQIQLNEAFDKWEDSLRESLHTINTVRKLNISSIIHMSINRLFACSNRLNEMVIYNYLSRYYISQLARDYQNNQNRKQHKNGK